MGKCKREKRGVEHEENQNKKKENQRSSLKPYCHQISGSVHGVVYSQDSRGVIPQKIEASKLSRRREGGQA